jgi:hypothetical protein
MCHHRLAVIAAAALFAHLCAAPLSAAKPAPTTAAYTIIPFRPPDIASESSHPVEINETGQVVGFIELSGGGYLGIHFDLTSGVYTELVGSNVASGINNHNEIVGSVWIGENVERAAYWAGPSAEPVILPPISEEDQSVANAINDDGFIVGYSRHPGAERGVVWRVTFDSEESPVVEGPRELPPLPGHSVTWGMGINNPSAGPILVTGSSVGVGIDSRMATVWTVGLTTEGELADPGPAYGLGTLQRLETSYSSADAINDFGDVCGDSDLRPFLSRAGQPMQPLVVPKDTQYSRATDINNVGEIVGMLDVYKTTGYVAGPGNYRAHLWRDGKTIDLNTQIPSRSGWGRLWAARTINDAGIIGGGGRYDVERRGFLLIPNSQ